MRGLWLPIAGFSLVTALASATEAGHEVTRLANGNVSVNARAAVLGTLLKQFGGLTSLETAPMDPKVEATVVDFAARDLPLTDALTAMLQSSGVAFVLWGQEGAGGLRLVAYPQGSSATATDGKQTAASAPPPPPPPLELPSDMDPAVAAAIRQGIAPDDPDLAMIGTGAPERTMNPEDDPDLAEILGPAPRKDDGTKKP